MQDQFFILLLLFLFAVIPLSGQQGQSLAYGTVLLQNGERYRGQIRWEDEEATWDEIFNAPKSEKWREDLLSGQQLGEINQKKQGFSLDFMELWEDRGREEEPNFRCNIGDLSTIEVIDDKIARVTLKNGATVDLLIDRGGDLREDIVIYGEGLGSLDLDWDEIKRITFQPPPENIRSEAGYPVYARVLTTLGHIEGWITWDSEECLGKDLISGYSKGTQIDIEFANITSLTARNDGSQIVLRSGREIFLTDHDDVSPSNNGILIRMDNGRKIELGWSNFISAEFTVPAGPGPAYDDYPPPRNINGTAITHSGRQYSGRLYYNLNQSLSNELLRGENNGFVYYIPFDQVSSVEPQNDQFASVRLRDGSQLLLGNSRGNSGILVQPDRQEPAFIPWNEIKSIRFND